jgi:hypothetical protein
LNFRRAFVRDGDGDAFAANGVEVHLVFLLNTLAQVLPGHLFLSEFNIEGAALLLSLRQVLAVLAQRLFARGNVGG